MVKQKMLGWGGSDDVKLCIQKTIVLLYMCTASEMRAGGNLRSELEVDFLDECSKLGPVDLVKVGENHPQDVVLVKFKDMPDAQKCIELMNERWFGGRQIHASEAKATLYEENSDAKDSNFMLELDDELDEPSRLDTIAGDLDSSSDEPPARHSLIFKGLIHVFQVCCWINKGYIFSSSRLLEIADLENKVELKGRAMLRNGIFRNFRELFVIWFNLSCIRKVVTGEN